uniref:Protein kinase domain-containing protein n=1 Tax=Oryza glumipatula TaxID=40148 RepID=A0A0E0BGX5_9ORYZ
MEIPTTELPSQFLREITDEFSDERKVGEGAFGIVYKGMLKDGTEIAVKKLRETSPIHDNQFKNEVGSLMKVNHRNIVKLIGYCYEIQKKVVEHNGKYILTEAVEKLLCYEYISNGSLDKHLFGESSRLDWHTRFNIIKGVCEGLHFLHKGSERPIIHLDIKPGNILLDDNMVPKIADFGLSRLLGEEQTRVCTQNVMGAIGYMAPEYLYRGEISTQSDIYSLGLLIIEITTGEKNFPNREDIIAKNFIENVHRNWTNMVHISLKYPSLDANCLQQVNTCIEMGLSCVQTNRKDRPSIGEIVNMLS